MMHKALTGAFEVCNQEVYSMIADVRFSGSTCVSCITFGRKLYCANVGDSRGIVIRAAPSPQNENGFTCEAISRDHKPCDKDEAAVILAANGRIDSYRDTMGN